MKDALLYAADTTSVFQFIPWWAEVLVGFGLVVLGLLCGWGVKSEKIAMPRWIAPMLVVVGVIVILFAGYVGETPVD